MQQRPSRLTVSMLVAAILAVIGYPLSIGPAAALVANGTITINTFDTIYVPINAACVRWPLVQDLVGWYIGLWAF